MQLRDEQCSLLVGGAVAIYMGAKKGPTASKGGVIASIQKSRFVGTSLPLMSDSTNGWR
jgi:hypothetical protein